MRGALLGLLAVGVVFASLPAAAWHASVGASATLFVSPGESPRDPSVGAALYERGTTRDCPAKAPPGAGAPGGQDGHKDALCGALVYHEGTPWTTLAPRDQRLDGPVGLFDVRLTHYAGSYVLETCLPWCLNPDMQDVYDGVNGLLVDLGVWEGDRADEADGGWQRASVDLRVPSPARLVQDVSGLGPADGWLVPAVDQTFVAFLEDHDGDPIGADRLASIVAETPGLPDRALPRVCGFTPHAKLSTTGSLPGCEVPFTWNRKQGAQGGSACRSRTYVCGVGSPAWEATVTCSPPLGACGPRKASPETAPVQNETVPRNPTRWLPESRTAGSSLQGTRVWHFVVAPSASACGAAREPGFSLTPGSPLPFLAHDLDLYTPLDAGQPVSVTSSVGELEARVSTLAATVSQRATDPLWHQHRPEPNVNEHLAGLTDTSGSLEVERVWHDCRLIRKPRETHATLDPWINLVDARLEREPAGGRIEGSLEAPAGPEGDRLRLGRYVPTGRVGFVADTDDDARFAQPSWRDQFAAPEQTGAYPVLWDMYARPDGRVATQGGCTVHGDALETSLTLPEAMRQAGYRGATGLVQALGFDEPVWWEHRPTGTIVPAPAGGVFLTASQAVHVLGTQADRPDARVEQAVQQAIAAAREGAGLGGVATVVLRDELASTGWLAPPSDYLDQCGEASGGFTSAWSVHRACGPGDCGTATVVTRLLLEQGRTWEPFQRGAAWAKPFPTGHRAAFEQGFSVWTDVDTNP